MKLLKKVQVDVVSPRSANINISKVSFGFWHTVLNTLVTKPLYLGTKKYPDSLTMLLYHFSGFYLEGLKPEEKEIFKSDGGY